MDPTLLAALAGILGAVIGSILGGVFALKATKRQIEVMLEQSRGDVKRFNPGGEPMSSTPPPNQSVTLVSEKL